MTLDAPREGATAGDWSRMWSVFHHAVDLPAAERAPYLAVACAGDEELRGQVAELLDCHQQSEGLLDAPARFLAEAAAELAGAPLPPLPRLAAGDVVASRFEVRRELGSGGMGAVYEALDRELGAAVALKTLRPEVAARRDARDRFRREIHLARRVTHPNVCRLFDLFYDDSRQLPFLTMELLPGETLAHRLARGPLPVAEALEVARRVAAGLAAAHGAGIVHRDLTSGNVILVDDRERRAVITDFGLATAADLDVRLTLSGTLLGTPSYMAPEQLQGGAASPATDVYALGLLLYEMTCGRLPFTAATPWAAALQRVAQPAPSPRLHQPDLDPRWAAVISRALERDPASRHRDAGELVADLAEAPGGAEGRRRWLIAALVTVVMAAALLAALSWPGGG
ncbi:MAG TPA: serine/threonine-protein kinase [Thermoanaerobaculia bacterium]|nr:serine/threonine-protein kinase [Thermoanaerobaculia bacterium]